MEVTCILCDNQSCIKLSENPVFHDRSKHIEIRYHYIRDMVQKGAMRLQYVAIDEQVADVLTKPLSRMKFEYFRDKLDVALFRGSDGFRCYHRVVDVMMTCCSYWRATHRHWMRHMMAHWKGIVEEIHFGGSIIHSTIIENLDLEKPSFRPSKWPQKLKPAKNSKLPKLPKNCSEPVGKHG
jgi:hypothetical protein